MLYDRSRDVFWPQMTSFELIKIFDSKVVYKNSPNLTMTSLSVSQHTNSYSHSRFEIVNFELADREWRHGQVWAVFLALTVIINIEFWLVVNGWPVAVDYQPSFETEWWKLKLLLLPSRRILAVFHDVFCKALIMRGIMRLGAVHIG